MKKIAGLILGVGLCLAPLSFPQIGKAQEEKKEESKGAIAEVGIGWVWANFIILAGVLGYLSVKYGGPLLISRAAEIRKGIDEAEQIKADSNAKIAAINSKLGRLDAEIASLRESAGEERRAAEQRLKDETQREIQRIHTHAEGEIEAAGKGERIALQRYASKLALELAETKVRARMNPDTENALVQAFIHGLGEPPARPQRHN